MLKELHLKKASQNRCGPYALEFSTIQPEASSLQDTSSYTSHGLE